MYLGFKVEGSRIGVQSFTFRLKVQGHRAWGLELRVQGSGFSV